MVGGQGVPISADLDSAWPSQIKLLEPTIEKIAGSRKGRGRPRKNPVPIIADKGYDSDPLGERLLKDGIELICPYRKTTRQRNMRMMANCGVTGVDGRLNVLLHGCKTSEDWLLVGTERFICTKLFSRCLQPHYIEVVLKWLLGN